MGYTELHSDATCERREEEELMNRMGDQMALRAVGWNEDEEDFLYTTIEKSMAASKGAARRSAKEARLSKS